MTKEKDKKDYYKILIPALILVFCPFPSKIIGYSRALYISDFVLMMYLIISCIKNKYKIIVNNSFIILMLFSFMNTIGIFMGILHNGADLRQFTEIVRSFEWIIIYLYMYNTIIKTKGKDIREKIEKNFSQTIFLILILSIVFVIIELFNLPLKSMLKNFYELGKSGNIFQYYNRIVGPFRNPNMFGTWIILAIASIITTDYRVLKKIIFLLVSVGMIYFTGSRTGIIIAVGIIVFIYLLQYLQRQNNKSKFKNFIVIIIAIIVSCIVIKENSELFYSVRLKSWKDDISDLNGRTQIWEQYKDDIENNLLLGNGIIKSNDIVFDNLYIQYMYYYGVIGILMLCALFFTNLRKTIVLYKQKECLNKNFVLFMLVIQITIIISGITIQIMDSLQIFYFYIFTMAYIDSKYYNKDKIENASIFE